MKNKTSVLNKLLSLVLVLMLAIPAGILPTVITSAQSEYGTVTEAELVADNYASLSDGEKALLRSGYMIGNSYTLKSPDNSDGLITVDSAAKTVEASAYTISDSEFPNGEYVWKPVAARVVYLDGEEEITLDSAYCGAFTYDGNEYSVEVDYEVELEVSAATQALLLNGPYYIAKMVEYADALDDNALIYSLFAGNIDKFNNLTTSTQGGGLQDTETIAAIQRLYQQVDTSADGILDIENYLNGYESAADAGTKLAYLYDEGLNFSAVAKSTYADLAQIRGDAQIDSLKSNSSFRRAIQALDVLLDETYEASNSEWEALNSEYNPLVAGIGSDDIALLSDAASAAVGAEYHEDTLKGSLVAGKTTLSKNIKQFNVIAKIKAYYIADTTIDSDALSELTEYETSVRVLEGATEAEIIAAIDASGIEQVAVNAWGVIDTDNYERTISAAAANLNGDLVYEIAYSPKNVSITYDFQTGLPSTVPYGYNLKLPDNPDTSLVYDYVVNNTEKYQGDVVRIASVTTITRTEGKPWTGTNLGKIIADVYAVELTEDEIAALSSVANKTGTIRVRVPSNSDDLVNVTYDTNGPKYKVVTDSFDSGIAGVIWIAVSGKAVKNGATVAEFDITGGAGEFDGNVDFDKVEVVYKTTLTNVSNEKTLETLNNVKLLVEDAAAFLDDMENLDELYSKLGQLDKSALNKIKVAVKGTDMSDESRAAVEALLAGCVDKTGSLYLYEYLTQYHTDGLAYVFKNAQYLKIKEQAEIVNANLNVIYNDPELLPVLRDFDLEDYYQKFEEIVNNLSRVQLAPEHIELVDTASPSIAGLTEALERLVGSERVFASASKPLTLNATVTAAAPGLSTVTVKVTEKNSAGAVLATKTDALVFSSTEPLTAGDIALVNGMLNALIADLGIDTVHYDTTDVIGLEAGEVLGGNASFTITYSPKVYTTTFMTSGQAIGTATFFFDNPTITLPGTIDDTVQYEYTVCGKKITVSTDAKTFTFTTAQINNGSYATVNRETLDAEREAFLALVKALNEASASAGLLSGRDMIVSFIPFENAEGDMAVVLRLAPDTMSRKQVEDALMNMIEEIAGSDYNYIKMADEYIRYDSTASLQAIINVLLDSGVCIDTYINAVDETGDIIEWSIDQNYVVLGAEYVDGIPGKLIKVGNNARINDVEILGGYIMESDMVFSKAEDDPGKAVKLYVTFEDFNRKTQELKDVRDAAKKVREHGNVILHDGIIDVTAKIPERGFQAYYASMAVIDNERLWEGDAAEFGRAIELLNKAVDFLAADNTITTTTIENTAAKINQDLDLSSIKGYFRNGIKVLNHILDNVDFTIVNSAEGIYDVNFHYDINEALDKAEVKDSIRSIIKEKDTGVEAAAKVTFTTTAPHYQAIIGDYQANGWDKLEFTQNLGASAPRAHDNTMILLLDDYTGDLIFNSIVYIDLNGHTINGNIISNSEVYILNDEYATNTNAGVTGTITGKATISGGRYNDDVSSKLEEGYIQDENGLVRGEYYFIYDNGEGDIEVHIDKEAGALGATGAIAYELAFKYALHFYSGAALRIGDRTLYELKAEDIIAMYEGGSEYAKDQLRNCVDEDAIRALASDISAAISDYVKDSHDVVSGEILATFPVEYNRFTFELTHVRNGNYITADIIPDIEDNFYGGEVTIMAHEFEEPVIVDPDCTNDGSETYVATCDDCDYTYVKELEALGHDPLDAVEENRIEADCTTAGSYDMVVYCSRCGEELERESFTIDKLPHTPGDWEVSIEPTPTTVGEKIIKCTRCDEILERKPYYYTIVPLEVVAGATVATAEVDNEARIITIVTKDDAKKAVFNLKLPGVKDVVFTMTDEAFAAGNELQIKGVRYNRQTDASGIRYFVSERNPGERTRTYDIEVIVKEGDTYVTYTYTVNITFVRSNPNILRDGVEPGVGADVPVTGFDPDDGDIYLVSLPGRERATFRLYLPKGASVKVDSEATPHLYQILNYNASTYHEVDNEHIDPNWFVYFQSRKSETENYEYRLCVTLANGDKIYHNVHVQFVD